MIGFERRTLAGLGVAYLALVLWMLYVGIFSDGRVAAAMVMLPAVGLLSGFCSHHLLGFVRMAVDSIYPNWADLDLTNGWHVQIKETWQLHQLVLRFGPDVDVSKAFDDALIEERNGHRLMVSKDCAGLIQCLGGDPKQPCPTEPVLLWRDGRLLEGLCVDPLTAERMRAAIGDYRRAKHHAKPQANAIFH